MSIKKKLLLSNVGMIVIPIICFFILEVILGYLVFVVFNGEPNGEDMKSFLFLRFIGMAVILIVTNGLLTYIVSKSIINPIRELSNAAKRISEGDLDLPIESDKKDELGQLTNIFNDMRINVKEANQAQLRYEKNRKELIASISHDLKTPLTSIKGYVTGLQDGVANTPEKLDRYMDTIYQKTNDMDHLIDELFLYSKLDLDREPFDFEEVELGSFLADYVEELSFDLEKSCVSMEFEADQTSTYLVEADRRHLKRAITNIVQNSMKYMDKDHKKMQVRLNSDVDLVTVEISDNGSGITKEELPYIFDRFYRTDGSRNSSTGGSGLGLAITKKIIDEHGGTVWAESDLGEGTSIYFTLKRVMS
ncbi:sensor histidine kinase [Virgibacillus flavescens]|uniref:sensor histidine kinase n=1 Tax=Virgibacillus flavescens TaxID=1611422 RepID=UPI003D3342E4